MKPLLITITIAFIWFFYTSSQLPAQDKSSPLIVDHTCENLSQIPLFWIDSAQLLQKWHYAHTSHGSQLTTGLERIENNDPDYDIAIGYSNLPYVQDALCVFDGQETHTYITPEEYWRTKEGMDLTRDVLNNNPSINVSQWSWCCQMNSYSEEDVQAYLDSISLLETEFPGVSFVYMTGNAQATGSGGYNRYLRNEQVRQYCQDNDKALFDFADLDAWWYNPDTQEWEQNTYNYNGFDVPVEHSQFNGNQAGHTTYESCEQKGRAVWWLMAKLSGWEGTVGLPENKLMPELPFTLYQNQPNPFTQTTKIHFTLNASLFTNLTIYDVHGKEVARLADEVKPKGEHEVTWDAKDHPSGIYHCRIQLGKYSQVMRMVVMK